MNMTTVFLIAALWFFVILASFFMCAGMLRLMDSNCGSSTQIVAGAAGLTLFGVLAYYSVIGSALIYEKTQPVFAQGIVIRRVHILASTTYVLAGKVMVPITNPERWELVIQEVGGERTKALDVSASTFEAADIGAVIPAN